MIDDLAGVRLDGETRTVQGSQMALFAYIYIGIGFCK